MAEIGIVASVIQIADTGLRLSIKLYTFGEIVSTADKSVISISKDVSLTSSVLKELGDLLENDRQSHIFSKSAVQTADTVVKECLEVFQEMESIMGKKLPSLSGHDGIREPLRGKKSKATALLERMKWGYLQPKLQLLRSNLDRLKSTLLLMLNVITYARQVAGKSENPSVIEDQRSLIEDLARSNRDYIRKFENLKLGIHDTTSKNVRTDDANSNDYNPEKLAPTNLNNNNDNIGTNMIVQDWSVPCRSEKQKLSGEAHKTGAETTELVFHLKHYLSLVNKLLTEVDDVKYEIRVDSRDRARTDVCQAYRREIEQLRTAHGFSSVSLAQQPLAPMFTILEKRLAEINERSVDAQSTKEGYRDETPQQAQARKNACTMQAQKQVNQSLKQTGTEVDHARSMPSNSKPENPDSFQYMGFEEPSLFEEDMDVQLDLPSFDSDAFRLPGDGTRSRRRIPPREQPMHPDDDQQLGQTPVSKKRKKTMDVTDSQQHESLAASHRSSDLDQSTWSKHPWTRQYQQETERSYCLPSARVEGEMSSPAPPKRNEGDSLGRVTIDKPRKATHNRGATACTTCSGNKIRCDPAEPTCVQCEESGRECRGQPITSSMAGSEHILDFPHSSRDDGSSTSPRVEKHPVTHSCSDCPATFTRAYDLRSHLRTHPNVSSVRIAGPIRDRGLTRAGRSVSSAQRAFVGHVPREPSEVAPFEKKKADSIGDRSPFIQDSLKSSRRKSGGSPSYNIDTSSHDFNLRSKRKKLSSHERVMKTAAEATSSDPDLDLDQTTSKLPTDAKKEAEHRKETGDPMTDQAANVVDELVALWTLLPTR